MNKHLKTLVLLFLISFSLEINAQIIWKNTITGSNPNTQNPYKDQDETIDGITVSGIGRSSEIKGSNSNNRYSASNWGTENRDTSKYFYFRMQASENTTFSIAHLLITLQRSNSAPNQIAIYTSKDDFAVPVFEVALDNNTTQHTIVYNPPIILDKTLEFRIYAWGASSTLGTLSVNDFTFADTLDDIFSLSLIDFHAKWQDKNNLQVHWTSSIKNKKEVVVLGGATANNLQEIHNFQLNEENDSLCRFYVNNPATLHYLQLRMHNASDEIFLSEIKRMPVLHSEQKIQINTLAFTNKMVIHMPTVHESLQIRIVDVQGKFLYKEVLNNNKNHRIEREIPFANPGIYYVQISNAYIKESFAITRL